MTAQRLPAEVKYDAELRALAAEDAGPRPTGWRLAPRAVVTYVMGRDEGPGAPAITAKYVGDRALVEVAVATLASDRALLLVGEPGTAKSWLSEHLAAAISGTSALVVQGTYGTTEDQVKFGWNYALLLAEGPSPRALVASPVLRAMREGKIARVEEITRAAPEVQDALISILSEKQIAVPELAEIASAERGFNLIATANTRDRGVNEMSAALRRRFNVVTVPVVEDLEQEIRIVTQREAELRGDYEVGAPPPEEITRVLVTIFQELRAGLTKDKKTKIKPPSASLSTAEAIGVLFQAGILAQQFGDGTAGPRELARGVTAAISKESHDDARLFDEYCETVVKGRAGAWKELYAAVRGKAPR
ncbi:MAG TPA: AAA family ATPase [Byssovorax sp.]